MKFKNILLATIILLGVILIVNVYLYWKSTVNDNNGYNSINALIALLALLVNIITIFFLYINYKQQQKHINKQEEEINNNRKDIEYNRVLDTVYKQLEFTNNELKEYYNEIVNPISVLYHIENTFDEMPRYTWIFNIMNTNYKLFDSILDDSNLDDKQKEVITNIIGANIYFKAILLYMQFHQIVKSVGGKDGYIKQYRDFINKEIQESLRVMDNINDSEIQNKYNLTMIRGNELVEDLFYNTEKLEVYIEKYKKKLNIVVQ